MHRREFIYVRRRRYAKSRSAIVAAALRHTPMPQRRHTTLDFYVERLLLPPPLRRFFATRYYAIFATRVLRVCRRYAAT